MPLARGNKLSSTDLPTHINLLSIYFLTNKIIKSLEETGNLPL